LFPKDRRWLGVEMYRGLEYLFHDEVYLVLICLVWISLGCMGSSISFEGDELLECKTSPRLLMDLEKTTKNPGSY
jgi:hypothetical protein